MSPMSNCPNRAWELMPNSSNMRITVGRRTDGSVLRRGEVVGSALDQRATAFGQRAERFLCRDGGADLVVVPWPLRLGRLLHFEQIHRMDLATVGAHCSL